MYASSKIQEQYPWWAGNARFIDLSNTFIVAHVAQAAIIMMWAGVFTLFELVVYSPDKPLYAQGLILLPHLAAEGWGVGSGGAIVNTSPIFAIGVIHIVAAGVLAGGAYFHRNRLPSTLESGPNVLAKFHFEWDNPKQLGLILGHHLIILGLGALLFVAKALFFGGLYDANIGDVRLVAEPTLDIGILWGYSTHLFDVNNLDDLVGGHIFVAVLLILGGAWHILMPPFKWVREFFLFSAEGLLAYSLFGIALAGFAASYYCGFNTLAYPVEFYGPTLELHPFLPRYFDPNATLGQAYTSRIWLANTHFYLAFFVLQGSIWHFQRALVGLDLIKLLKNWQQKLDEASDNPSLIYQDPVQNKPQMMFNVQYGAPQANFELSLKQEQSFEDYVYCRSHIEQPNPTTINGVPRTLYQITFHDDKNTLYKPLALKDAKARFDERTRSPKWVYEQSIQVSEELVYPQPLNTGEEPGYGRSQYPIDYAEKNAFYESPALEDAKLSFDDDTWLLDPSYGQPKFAAKGDDSPHPLDTVYKLTYARSNASIDYDSRYARSSTSANAEESTLYQSPAV